MNSLFAVARQPEVEKANFFKAWSTSLSWAHSKHGLKLKQSPLGELISGCLENHGTFLLQQAKIRSRIEGVTPESCHLIDATTASE